MENKYTCNKNIIMATNIYIFVTYIFNIATNKQPYS